MSTFYRSYLLRLWLEPNDPPVLRAMLESTTNGERHGFASIENLFMFLVQEAECMGQEIDFTPPNKFSRQGPTQAPD